MARVLYGFRTFDFFIIEVRERYQSFSFVSVYTKIMQSIVYTGLKIHLKKYQIIIEIIELQQKKNIRKKYLSCKYKISKLKKDLEECVVKNQHALACGEFCS